MNQLESEFQTGDVILFHGDYPKNTKNMPVKEYITDQFLGWFNRMVEWATKTPYSHVGIVLKDPTWINKDLKGIYLWESSYEGFGDSEDHKKKFGVQIVPLFEVIHKFPGTVYHRKLQKTYQTGASETIEFPIDTLEQIHSIVHDKPYDINVIDWLSAWIRKDPHPDKTSRFWCSALVGYIYIKLGILPDNIDWSILRPDYFSDLDTDLNQTMINGYSLGNQIKLN